MSKPYDPYPGFPSASRKQGLPAEEGEYYPPPQNVDQYASRPLPPPPSPIPQASSSIYDSAADYLRQHPPQELWASSYAETDRRGFTPFGNTMNDEAPAMVQPLRLAISNHSESYEHHWAEPSLPRRPNAKLLAMWATGDELVSPIDTDTPRTEGWSSYVVSPLSEEPGRGSMDAESWFDDSISDEVRPWDSSDCAQEEVQPMDAAGPHVSQVQSQKEHFRYSDPGSPIGFGPDRQEFGRPGLAVGGSQHFSSDGHSRYQDNNVSTGDSKVAFPVATVDTFSSDRTRAGSRPAPPPLKLNDRPISEDYVKTPLPARRNSGESSLKQPRRRSGFGSFGASIRSATQKIQRPPPGFTEVISLLDYQGVRVSPVPRVRNILSKAKQGLGIGADDPRKDKKQDEFAG